jgi:DNA-binding transcriptional LysR family regulator
MDLRLLELFVAVAEEGSIHGGARRLMIAQPAVSKDLRRLERGLGVPLVDRSAHGTALTPAGEVLIVEARTILDRIGRTAAAVRRAGGASRRITVGLIAGAVAAGDLTGEIVDTYRRDRPDVEVSVRVLTFPDQFSALATGEVDVALVRPPCLSEELEIRPLFDEPILLCCSGAHDLADAGDVGVDDVLDRPMLNLAGAPRDWTDFWHLQEYRGGPARTIGDPVTTLAEMQLAIGLGEIVAPVCASAWRLALAAPGLRAVPLRDGPRSRVAAACRRGEKRSDALAFLDAAVRVTDALAGTVPGSLVPTG